MKVFNAKVLLFGEYSIIFDSMALSVPFDHFSARFCFMPDHMSETDVFPVRSNRHLKDYCSWLEFNNNQGELKGYFDIAKFILDIEAGIYLDSDIPEGYGLGSSGALCSAVYDRYAVSRIDNSADISSYELRELKRIFAVMESWFHGTSSGLDPMNCYLGSPLLVEPDERISIINIPPQSINDHPSVFLIDTGKPGKTEPLVNLFLNKSKDENYRGLVFDILIPAVDSCISSILKPDIIAFMANLKTISRFQFDHMSPMIPPDFIDLWESGLNSDDFYLKLCGSGGGGYLLCYTNKMAGNFRLPEQMNIRFLPVHI